MSVAPEPACARRNRAALRRWLLLGAALLAWLTACYALRFGFMEVEAAADGCFRDPTAWRCELRAWLGKLIHFQRFGITALLLALAAVPASGRLRECLALLSLFAAAVALVLYNVAMGAPAAVFALLLLDAAWRGQATDAGRR
jgi:hypothetical protein